MSIDICLIGVLVIIFLKPVLWSEMSELQKVFFHDMMFLYTSDDETYENQRKHLPQKGMKIADYKHRASTGGGLISLYSITPDEIEEAVCLSCDASLKYIVYYLGTLIHKIAHNIDLDYLKEYGDICLTEPTYITDYVRKNSIELILIQS